MKKLFLFLYILMASLIFFTCSSDSAKSSSADTGFMTDAATYTVTYDGNGNDAGEVPEDSAVYKEGDIITLPENTGNIGKRARNFAGWNTMADGSMRTYKPGQSFTMGKSNVTFYAIWSFWTRLTGAADTYTRAIKTKVDANGNIYVLGYTNGSLDDQTYTGTSFNYFLIKYNAFGERLWTRQFGGPMPVRSIAVDSAGNIYMTGSTQVSLDGDALIGNASIFIIKYDTNGNRLWTKLTGGNSGPYGSSSGESIAVDANDNIYVAGIAQTSFDGETVSGSWDTFVMKYNSEGEKEWTRFSGVPSEEGSVTCDCVCITADSAGNCYVSGQTLAAFDNQTLIGTQDDFIIKYDTSGNKVWTRFACARNAKEFTVGRDIAVDNDGNVYVTGEVGVYAHIADQAFLMKYNLDGEMQWQKLVGISYQRTGRGIAIDVVNNIYITGDFHNCLESYDLPDVYVSKFDSYGNKKWFKHTGVGFFNHVLRTNSTYGADICADAENNIYVSGSTDGPLANETFSGGTWDAYITTIFNGTDSVAVTNY